MNFHTETREKCCFGLLVGNYLNKTHQTSEVCIFYICSTIKFVLTTTKENQIVLQHKPNIVGTYKNNNNNHFILGNVSLVQDVKYLKTTAHVKYIP